MLIYLLAITSSNVVTAGLSPFFIGPFIIPAGTFIIGATFIFRDLVQNYVGRRNTYLIILLAMFLSALTSYLLGDTLWIVFASIITFAVSETTDTEIYSRLNLPLHLRVAYSGIVGGILDSIIFVIVGLSPLGANILPWNAVFLAVVGQIIVKVVIQLIAAIIVKKFVPKVI
ncbi:hypothetical protein BSK47_20095 [Paenibacillus odorifer]|uniref:VUT family protein n=1 Tax=Paenibacillus odorifer TaxID=189426 RepID=A0AB36JBP3_9BACL|nr:hypothetical protein BSK47_20095 [Paenibacillus odorifer]